MSFYCASTSRSMHVCQSARVCVSACVCDRKLPFKVHFKRTIASRRLHLRAKGKEEACPVDVLLFSPCSFPLVVLVSDICCYCCAVVLRYFMPSLLLFYASNSRLFWPESPFPSPRHCWLAAWLPRVIQLLFNYIQHSTETALPPHSTLLLPPPAPCALGSAKVLAGSCFLATLPAFPLQISISPRASQPEAQQSVKAIC